MSNSYTINKGINTAIEFKGLKAQYIWWLGAGTLVLMVVFATLYFIGVTPVVCVLIVGGLGAGWFVYVFRLSARYGAYGLMKKKAARRIPNMIRSESRILYLELSKRKTTNSHEQTTTNRINYEHP